MHLTLKRATTRPAANNILQQQERFDRFRREYNEERPHESLGMKTPATFWKEPERRMPRVLPEPNYEREDLVRMVTNYGRVQLRQGQAFTLGSAFIDHPVALTEIEDKVWRVRFMNYELGLVDEETGIFSPNEELTLLPMS
jgi:hypothetical protein